MYSCCKTGLQKIFEPAVHFMPYPDFPSLKTKGNYGNQLAIPMIDIKKETY